MLGRRMISRAETVHPPRAVGGAEVVLTEHGCLSGRRGPTNNHGHAREVDFVSSVSFVVQFPGPSSSNLVPCPAYETKRF